MSNTKVIATIKIAIFGAYSYAHCAETKTGKLKSAFVAGDAKGKRLLAKAIAAYNRGDEVVSDANGDVFSFTVKKYAPCDLDMVF